MAKRKAETAIEFVKENLDHYDTFGMRTDRDLVTMGKVADKIVWLWKWKLITDQEKDEFCDKATEIFEKGIIPKWII